MTFSNGSLRSFGTKSAVHTACTSRALEWCGGQRCLQLFSRIDEKAGIWNNSLELTLTSVTGGAYKVSDGALTLITGFLCDDSASLQAHGERHLFFAGGCRVYGFVVPVLEMPLCVGMNIKFFDRPSPEVPIYKTGEMISCFFITLVRVLKIELSQPLEYRSNQVFDDFWSGT